MPNDPRIIRELVVKPTEDYGGFTFILRGKKYVSLGEVAREIAIRDAWFYRAGIEWAATLVTDFYRYDGEFGQRCVNAGAQIHNLLTAHDAAMAEKENPNA